MLSSAAPAGYGLLLQAASSTAASRPAIRATRAIGAIGAFHVPRPPSAARSDTFHSPDDIVILPKRKRRILRMRHCQIVAKAVPLAEAGRCRGGS